MSLNPIAFGEHVVEQFQRYLLTYFPAADSRLEEQVAGHLLPGPLLADLPLVGAAQGISPASGLESGSGAAPAGAMGRLAPPQIDYWIDALNGRSHDAATRPMYP